MDIDSIGVGTRHNCYPGTILDLYCDRPLIGYFDENLHCSTPFWVEAKETMSSKVRVRPNERQFQAGE